MARQARVILFDATGTLIALREPAGETYARIAREFGLETSAARLQAALSKCLACAPAMAFPQVPEARVPALERAWWREIVRDAFREAGAPLADDALDACFERLFEHFAGPRAWRATPGAIQALEALREADFQTGVISNFDLRLRGILDGLGFGPLLDCVVIPAYARAVKPAREIFDHALDELAASADEAIFVGDQREPDLEGARRAGLRAIDVGTLATLADLPRQIPLWTRHDGKENR